MSTPSRTMPKPTVRTGGKKIYLHGIKRGDRTEWEQIYHARQPSHAYVIWSNWSKAVRDVVAFIKCEQLREHAETGTHRTRRYTALIRAYDAVVEGRIVPSIWTAYVANPRTLTPDRASAKRAWEQTPPSKRPKAKIISYQEFPDGTRRDQAGRVVGRWKTVLEKVLDYAKETRHGKAHVRRWQQAAVALGSKAFPGVTALTLAEARAYKGNYKASRWGPVVEALKHQATSSKKKTAKKKTTKKKTTTRSRKVDQAKENAYVNAVKRFQTARDRGEPTAQQGFDEWQRQRTPNGKRFPFNGTYIEDTRTGCYLAHDKVAKRRAELTATNVRYRLDRSPNGMAQLSWLALNYEGCLCVLPHNTETKTRMVPAAQVPKLIWNGWRVLTHKAYSKNQHRKGAKDDKFEAFKLWVQYDPQGTPLGVCPTQGDSRDGKWTYNEDLFARLHSHAVEELAPAVNVPVDIANAILDGDWAMVAKLARARA